jgi:hypothetical protein
MKGDVFQLIHSTNDGLWYGHLHGHYSPKGPIAQSGRGYTTKQAAERSIRSAQGAMAGADNKIEGA